MLELPNTLKHQPLESSSIDSSVGVELSFPYLDPNALFWWNSTSEHLRILLSLGGYSYQQRYQALTFYRRFIVSSLGPRPILNGQPSQWKSFMTDDYTPIEYSLAWGNSKGAVSRRIRFSMEAISEQSGTATDPWNRSATFELVKLLEAFIPDADFRWFYWLSDRFTSSKMQEAQCSQDHSSWLISANSRSSLFLAFELGDDMPLVKSYMLPFAKQTTTGKSSLAVIIEILSTYECCRQWPSLPTLLGIWTAQSASFDLDPIMIAIDCIAPSKSRMKVYARTPHISLGEVLAVMSMFEDKSKILNGLEELSELWHLVFSHPRNDGNEKHTGQLPFKEHNTSGILFYFEVRPGSSKITTKVYLPVRHYGHDDLSIARGLQTFIQKRRVLLHNFAENFVEALQQICAPRRLEAATGLQTYISCRIDNDALDITSYLNPEIYNKRDSI
ncbi:hypothetical protein ACMFMG_004377 [Clarireedia jacksonii]